MLTILSAFAQEESRSASDNQKWSIRKGFEEGELMCLRTMFGYRISKETGIEVDSKNAGIVREIYARKTRFPAASAPRLEPANSQPFFPLSQQPPFMAYLLLMHFCPFSPILLFKLPYLGATEQLRPLQPFLFFFWNTSIHVNVSQKMLPARSGWKTKTASP